LRNMSFRRNIGLQVSNVCFLFIRLLIPTKVASLIPYGTLFEQRGLPSPECMLIVDSGFSFTSVVPLIEGKIVWNAVKRFVCAGAGSQGLHMLGLTWGGSY
jgi:actin-related protein